MIVIANKTGSGIDQKIISQLLDLSFPYSSNTHIIIRTNQARKQI
jgi:hypothetical protein